MSGFLAALPLIGKVIDRIIPDPEQKAKAQLALMEISQKSDLAELDADVKLALGQMEINKEEARSGSWWIAGGRPFLIWIGGFGMAWNFIVQPLVMWYGAFLDPVVTIPRLDVSELMILLGGILGLGGMRSYDKRNGAETRVIQ